MRQQSASGLQRHSAKVQRVIRQLSEHPEGRPVSLKKKTVSHQVPKRRDLRYRDEKTDVSDLDEILEIDTGAMTCTAEPGVTFHELVQATLPLGLVPIIVPEHKTITLGGAVAGCSLESMSFRYGGFHDTCLEYELIAATGELYRCTPDNEHRLLFQMVHGSFGTLGILSRLKFKLLPAKPYVRVSYEKYSTLGDFKAALWGRMLDPDVHYMDGMFHSPDEYVLSLGSFVDQAPYTNRYDWTKVYYQSTARRREDYLATLDYLYRYDRGVTGVRPRSFVGRALFGKFVHSDSVLRMARRFHQFLPEKQPRVFVDVFVPFSRVDAFMEWYRKEIGHFPVWCVPYRRVRDYEWLSPRFWAAVEDPLFLDLAFYGVKQRGGRNYYQEIEDELLKVHGVKTLISYNYYDEEVFWSIWNRPTYEAVKQLTDPRNLFRDLYVKTCRAARGLEDPDQGTRARGQGAEP